jgi:hypothetical protein
MISPKEAREDREKFSHQTLLLTALTAVNNINCHPSLNDSDVNRLSMQYMKDKAAHTPIIDAATTILVTDSEILATMAYGVQDTHSILALKEVKEEDSGYKDQLDVLLHSDSNGSDTILEDINRILPADFDVESHRC